MARAARSEEQSGWHHVTNRGIDRQVVFRSVDDRIDFGRLIASGHDKFGVEVLAYCLMGNHFHLVLNCPRGGLSAFMQDLGAKFTRHANERRGGDGAVFRGRFFSRAIPSNEHLLNAVRYVHRNPLDLRPRVALQEYRWSSHRTYLGLRPAPAWRSKSPVLDWFESASAFHAFVSAAPDGQPITATAADVTAAIMQIVDEMAASLDRAPQGVARTATYLLLDRVDDRTRADLVERLASGNATALAQAVRRSRRVAEQNPQVAGVVERALELCGTPVQVVSDTTWTVRARWGGSTRRSRSRRRGTE